MNEVLKQIQKIGIVPVVVLDDARDAVPLAKALIDGGLPCAEVTFRTAAAEESIKSITAAFPDMLVGAGTVLTVENVKKSMAAGARFIVSPGFNPKVVSYCVEHDIPITPGVSSPTDIETALEFGLDVVKFFPAEASGGLSAIKAMAAPYTQVKFMPTGGITPANVNEYLSYNRILACGGSWMVKGDLVKTGDFDKITALTKEAVMTVLGFELAHVGVNCGSEEEAGETAAAFAGIFGLETKNGNSSVFAGTMLEAIKQPYLGARGHIAVKANQIDRAVSFLESQGVEMAPETAKYKDDRLQAIYLKKEIGGFAIHLLQK